MCFYIFFAGQNRSAQEKLGVRQFYSENSSKKAEIGSTQKNAQFTVSEIICFLNEFEIPSFVYERMSPQSSIWYFKENEVADLETKKSKTQEDAYEKNENFISELKIALQEL